ncbi:hypothetical protein BGZ67_003948 [Mortierella alpina]|nr:hypothetical protein BGZ67_003948 [Mortierella alpina]
MPVMRGLESDIQMPQQDESRRWHGTSQEDAMAMDIDVMMAMMNGRKREEELTKTPPQPWLRDMIRKGSDLQVEREKKLRTPASQDRAEKREGDDPSEMDMIVDRSPLWSKDERGLERDFDNRQQRTPWSEEKELESLQEEEDNQGAEREEDNVQELTEMKDEEEEEEGEEEDEEDRVLMEAEDRVYEAEEALEEAMEELQEERAEARGRRKGVDMAEQVAEEGDRGRQGGEADGEEGGGQAGEEGEQTVETRDEFRGEDEAEGENDGQRLEDDQFQAKHASAEGEDEEEYQQGDRLGQAGPSETMDDET